MANHSPTLRKYNRLVGEMKRDKTSKIDATSPLNVTKKDAKTRTPNNGLVREMKRDTTSPLKVTKKDAAKTLTPNNGLLVRVMKRDTTQPLSEPL